MDLIEIKNVSFSYKKCEILKEISYKFSDGKVYAILGHNGAGKTTLIRLLLNILKPKSGEIKFINNCESSYIPDSGGLYDLLTVEENIKIFAMLCKKDEQWINDYSISSLKRWNLTSKAKTVVNKLSMGQKQRLSLIIATVNDPDIIYFDEPSNSIDINTQKMLNEYIIELKKQGKTIIICSHDIKLIENVSDEIIIINNKQIVFTDTIESISDIISTYKHYTNKE